MVADEVIQTIMRGTPDQQKELMSHYHLIDLGVILNYNEDGTVNVRTLYIDGRTEVTFTNIEVLYIGTNAGAITCNAEGSLCLLLKPMVCIPDTSTLLFDPSAEPFSNRGMKAIPITRGNNTLLKTNFAGTGEFSIEGSGYSVSFTKDDVVITAGGNSTLFSVAHGFSQVLCNGNLLTSYTDTISKVLSDADGNELLSETIDADGQVTITKGTVSVSITDDENDDTKQVVTVSNGDTSFSIDKDGNLTINCAGKLTLKGKGVEIDSGSDDQVVIKGKGLDAIGSHLEVS